VVARKDGGDLGEVLDCDVEERIGGGEVEGVDAGGACNLGGLLAIVEGGGGGKEKGGGEGIATDSKGEEEGEGKWEWKGRTYINNRSFPNRSPVKRIRYDILETENLLDVLHEISELALTPPFLFPFAIVLEHIPRICELSVPLPSMQ